MSKINQYLITCALKLNRFWVFFKSYRKGDKNVKDEQKLCRGRHLSDVKTFRQPRREMFVRGRQSALRDSHQHPAGPHGSTWKLHVTFPDLDGLLFLPRSVICVRLHHQQNLKNQLLSAFRWSGRRSSAALLGGVSAPRLRLKYVRSSRDSNPPMWKPYRAENSHMVPFISATHGKAIKPLTAFRRNLAICKIKRWSRLQAKQLRPSDPAGTLVRFSQFGSI